MKKAIMLLFCLLLAAALTACGNANDNKGGNVQTPAPPGETNGGENANNGSVTAEEAETLYRQHCLACHGDNREGRGGNTNISNVGSRLSQEEIAAKITNGGNGMPAFGGQLSDGEINTLSEWLAAMK
ncbi:c-type cytochrome [Paenibacillus senegalensis]|uniref:c-type cytochrome n=1 Tax=Paenibacillus senegalensis TaxID=1465766 RepID=UPI0002894C68|nr:cytochrome c [Paenibacillus senegalensis]